MQGILYEESSAWTYILLTIVLGGGAAFQMGRAVAQTWRAFRDLFSYAVMLAIGIRFLHFALFQGTLTSIHYLLADFIVLFAFSAVGWRMQRTQQMRTQYSFAFEGAGPFTWRRKNNG